MAKKPIDDQVSGERTEARTLPPFEGGNSIFAAWDMFYWIFKCRASDIQVTNGGVVLVDLTMDGRLDIDQVSQDIARAGNHRINFLQAFGWATGQIPEKPMNGDDITAWVTQWFGGAGGGGKKTPDYARELSASYKLENHLALGRGRPAKIMKIDDSLLEHVDDMSEEDIQKFRVAFDKALRTKHEANALAAS